MNAIRGCAILFVFFLATGCQSPAKPSLSKMQAAENGDVLEIQSILYWDSGLFAGVNAPVNKTGVCMIHLAAANGHADAVEFIISKGGKVNSLGHWGYRKSALHIAAEKGHYRVAAVLIAEGANINIRDGNGRTPLELAKANGHDDVMKLFEKYQIAGEGKR